MYHLINLLSSNSKISYHICQENPKIMVFKKEDVPAKKDVLSLYTAKSLC
jgi:hypothetical protein